MQLDSSEYWELSVRRSVSRLFLLAALAQRPMHGYELSQAVAELSGECCAPSDAAIYPTIRELSEGGYVTCETQSHGARPRNVCTLTARGRAALAAGGEAWGSVLPYIARVVEAADAPAAPVAAKPEEQEEEVLA
jgi:DNA-binding PadR family transcriptional regulator